MPTLFAGSGGFISILVIGVVVVIIMAILKAMSSAGSSGPAKPLRTESATPDVFPYERKASLFTQHELRLYHARVAAFPHVVVHGKTRLEDVVKVERGLDQSRRTRYRNFIKRRHVDMVICDARSGAIYCAIELDDSTHDSAKARHADAIKNGALAAAGVPLVRLTGTDASVGRLRQLITQYLPLEQTPGSSHPSKTQTEPAAAVAAVELERSGRAAPNEND